MSPYLSLIIPAYNEESRICRSLGKALDYFGAQSYDYEIIVVDDGSKDNTIVKVKEFAQGIRIIPLNKNLGKGAAVRGGMLAAEGRYRIFSDADFSTPIHEIKRILEKLESGADICIGSRAIDRSLVKVHQAFYREFMGKMYNRFVQFLVFKGIKDTQCGFKGFTAKVAEELFARAKIDGFSFDVEILYLARLAGFSIEQIPVEWYNDQRSTVNPVKDSINMLLEIFKIRRLHRG